MYIGSDCRLLSPLRSATSDRILAATIAFDSAKVVTATPVWHTYLLPAKLPLAPNTKLSKFLQCGQPGAARERSVLTPFGDAEFACAPMPMLISGYRALPIDGRGERAGLVPSQWAGLPRCRQHGDYAADNLRAQKQPEVANAAERHGLDVDVG